MGNISIQDSRSLVSAALTATGNLFVSTDSPTGMVRADGYNGAIYLEIQKTGAGTLTITPQTNFDASPTGVFYNAGYYRVDGQATLTRTVGPFAVGVGTVSNVLQILDGAPVMQFAVVATGVVSVVARLYLVPA